METVFLERCRQTWSSSWCDTCFKTVESFAQELIGVCPEILSWLVVDIFTFALVLAFVNNVTDDWVLHGDTRKLTNISSSGLIILV